MTGRADALSYWSVLVLGIIAPVLIVCAATLFDRCLFLNFGRYVVDKAPPGKEPDALRAAAVYVRAICPGPGGLITALAKLLHRH